MARSWMAAVAAGVIGLLWVELRAEEAGPPSESEPMPQTVAVVGSSPVTELMVDALITAMGLPALVVDEGVDVEAAARLARARLVVTKDAVWDIVSGTPHQLPKGTVAERVRVAAEQVAALLERPLSPLAAENLGRGASDDQSALESWSLARRELRRRRYSAAEKAARKALARDRNFVRARATLAMALVGENKLEQAERAAAEALAQEPTLVDAKLARAKVFDYRQETGPAAVAYREVLEVAPFSYAALNNLGLILWNVDRDLGAAVDNLQRARRADPTNPAASFNLARVYLEMDRMGEAIELLEEAKAARPDDYQAQALMSTALARAGQVAAARVELDQISRRLEKPPIVVRLARAEVAILAGEHEEALREVAIILEAEEDHPLALTLAGRAHEATGNPVAAEKAYRRALAAAPRLAWEARRNLALIKAGSGDRKASGALLEEACQLNPRDADAHYNLGVLALTGGDKNGAAEHFTAAVDIAPYLAPAHYNLALLEADRGEVGPAEEHLRQAITHQPEAADARLALAVLLRRSNRAGEAIEVVEAALEFEGAAQVELSLTLGLLLHEKGERDRARPYLESYLQRAAAGDERRSEVARLVDR